MTAPIPISICGKQFLINVHKESELLSDIIREKGVYSRNDLMVFNRFLNNGDYFIDVGANIGWHTLFGANLVGVTGKVFAFEPSKKNFDVLTSNIQLNNITNVVAINKALSNHNNNSKLVCSISNFGDNIISDKLSGNSEDISCTTLDNYIKSQDIEPHNVKLIKMDIQGSEAHALEGMKHLVEEYYPPIIIEYCPNHLKLCKSSPFDILSFIDRHNYIPFQLREEHHLTELDILDILNVQDLINATEYLFSNGWSIDLLLVQQHHKKLLVLK